MITFILIDYKSCEKTIDYIKRIACQISNKNISFIIIDNSVEKNNYKNLVSHLKVGKKVEENIKIEMKSFRNISKGKIADMDTYICENMENSGFAKANNLGYRLAKLLYQPRYIIFTNNDIFFKDNFVNINSLLKYLNGNVGLVGPKVVGLDGKDQSPGKQINIYNRWINKNFIYPFNIFLKFRKDNDIIQKNKNDNVFRISGAFMVFKAEIFETIGMFDENTFLYGEELIIAKKMILNKFNTYFCNDITMIHEHSTIISSHYNNLEKIKLRFNSELYYYRTYCNVSHPIILLAKFSFMIYKMKYSIFFKLKNKIEICFNFH